MKNTLSYRYKSRSILEEKDGNENLLLSKFSEVQKGNSPCFFWGKLKNPFVLSRCLIALSKVVSKDYREKIPPKIFRDPIVTAGNEQIRFEAFSQCSGVYARVDVLEDGHAGEFIENGTTNVDFNQPLLNALSQFKGEDNLVLSVGKKEVGFHKDGESIIEKKVPLPERWIKGLTTIQQFFAESTKTVEMDGKQAAKLFERMPSFNRRAKNIVLLKAGNRYRFFPSGGGIMEIPGSNRLELIKPLIPYCKGLKIYSQAKGLATTFVLQFDTLNFIFSISCDINRGFAAEGAALEYLLEDLPGSIIQAFDNYTYTNQSFNPTLMSFEEGIDLSKIENLSAKLAAMGLLGHDLERNHYFYRRLPFNLDRIMSLNPRLMGVETLLKEDKVLIVAKDGTRISAIVQGTDSKHTVEIRGEHRSCTCLWHQRFRGVRGGGDCKHILATIKKAKIL